MLIRQYIDEFYPSEDQKINEDNLFMFWNFVYKRHLIWVRRFVSKLPKDRWTNDRILKFTKYTNVYRELDRGTIWYLDTVAQKFLDKKISLKVLIWRTVIYRLCNRIETFEEVGFPKIDQYDSDILHNDFWKRLHKIEERKQPIMTSAHLTCPTRGGLTKVEGFIEAVNSLHKNLSGIYKDVQLAESLPEIFKILKRVHCVGAFTAYEVICDLMYTKSIKDQKGKPFIEDDWANVGPGAYQGIRLLFPSSAVGAQRSKTVYKKMIYLRDDQHKYFERYGIDFPFYERFTKGHLSLRSIEHDLCEFSKFWLQKHNLGKQRMVFIPNDNRIVEKDSKKYRLVLTDDGEHIEKVYLG